MNPERQDRVKKLFLAACELDEAGQAAFIEQACRGEPDIRAEVESLLRHHLAETIIDPSAAQPEVRRIPVVEDSASGVAVENASPPNASQVPSRFIAGEMVADRYRIETLLGRGGMGEVYRAEDLKLGRTVALKFLTSGRGHDPAWLARFYSEARIALRITDPRICRVYDLGDADGEAFISMEYIDGEDLASLLKRIGRLPQDKAIEIARQICYGLASAHALDVLHRDLKPANVMLDGKGNVRITDFGIAALASAGGDRFLPAGTPGYMAPETTLGTSASVSADIYSLGLILYEMATGHRALDKATSALQQRRDRLVPPSEHVKSIDPAFERVILKCLEDYPGDRPASVYEVLAALPGGDPLSAALAAGELPSPTLVARASSGRPVRPRVAIAWLIAAAVGLAAVVLLSGKTSFFVRAGLNQSPDWLDDAALHVLEVLGPKPPPKHVSGSFSIDPDGLEVLRGGSAAPVDMSMGEDREGLVVSFDCMIGSPRNPLPRVFPELRSIQASEPAASGVIVRLDPHGRLIEYVAPPETIATDPASHPEWRAALDLAGFDASQLMRILPFRAPPVYADVCLAWEGKGHGGELMRVQAASIGNEIVYFKVFRPWCLDSRDTDAKERRLMAGNLYAGVLLLTLVFSLILAAYNVRIGRCDRRGAWRLAALFACLALLLWIVQRQAGESQGLGAVSLLDVLPMTVFAGFIVWVYYLALEPMVRRFWPHSIISWSRVLIGRWRDDLVGRDILIGAVFGLVVVLLQQLNALLPIWTGNPSPLIFLPGNEYDLGRLTGLGYAMETCIQVLLVAIGRGMLLLMLMLILRMVLRASWPAGLGFTLIATTMYALNTDADSLAAWAMCAIVCGSAAVVLLRAGLLALVVSLFVTRLLVTTPITTDPYSWCAGMSGFSLLLTAALLLLGLYASLTTHLRATAASR